MTTNKMQLFRLIYLFLISNSIPSMTTAGSNIGGQYQKL